MKKINHWINGKNVAGADYFHTTNPATGDTNPVMKARGIDIGRSPRFAAFE